MRNRQILELASRIAAETSGRQKAQAKRDDKTKDGGNEFGGLKRTRAAHRAWDTAVRDVLLAAV